MEHLTRRHIGVLFNTVGLSLLVFLSLPGATTPVFGQSVGASADATVQVNTVPRLIRYSGILVDGRGYPLTAPVDVTFSLYQEQNPAFKTALWQETQRVSPNEKGNFTVYLGGASAQGLPPEVFADVSAQWLGIKVEGEPEESRTLLASVPYALKAGDAATLGGLPASAFALAGTPAGGVAPVSSPAATPDADSTVTTPGGTANTVPIFTGASTIGNSVIVQSGKSIGIGKTPNTGAILDVNGGIILRGSMTVSRTGNATATKGYPSNGFDFYANAYNSSTKAADNPHFQLQAEPVGNNTPSTSATFNLLYANGGTAAETGFYISPNGIVHFASGQMFPGTGAITGVTAGTGLTGGGAAGAVTLNVDTTVVPTLTDSPTFTGSVTVNSDSNSTAITGNSTTGYGVSGYSTGSYGGVFGNGNTSVAALAGQGPGDGIYGESEGSGIGVQGLSNSGTGVLGLSLPNSSTASTYDVEGVVAGVWGDTGISATNNALDFGGILGTADDNHAGVFVNASNTYPSLIVSNKGSGGTGLFRTLQASTSDGTCGIGGRGDLSCTGQIKSLVSTGSSARTVETYAMQSPESWMEDFGSGALTHGTARVALDSGFAQTINAGVDYHVFLTPSGDCKGLYVANRTADGFEVRELGGGVSNVAFDYRIVAKRAGYEAQRLTDVTERFQAETSRETARMKMAASPGVRQRRSVERPRMAVRPIGQRSK